MTRETTTITVLGAEDVARLREVRLTALRQEPSAFLSTFDEQVMWSDDDWTRELRRGTWLVAADQGDDVGLIGATSEDDIPRDDRYASYMWVHPDRRREGIGTLLLMTLIARLREGEVSSLWLWVMDDNPSALRLYEQTGFRLTGDRQPLAADPTRHEVRMIRRL
ncbi:putative GCN5-related N-acetyltransferase [metagenome]|uniref:Putative GCN5-related N-acetyltransferase n=1 Tax=metagenome TaxID=256318 RepID=A0A2P2CIS8_9ZZZZ